VEYPYRTHSPVPRARTRGLSTPPDKLHGSIIPRITNPRIFNDARNRIQGLMKPIASGCLERRLVSAPIRTTSFLLYFKLQLTLLKTARTYILYFFSYLFSPNFLLFKIFTFFNSFLFLILLLYKYYNRNIKQIVLYKELIGYYNIRLYYINKT